MGINLKKRESDKRYPCLEELDTGDLFRFQFDTTINLVVSTPDVMMFVDVLTGEAEFCEDWLNRVVIPLDGYLEFEEKK